MRHWLLRVPAVLALALLPPSAPARAQDAAPPGAESDSLGEGMDLLGRGAELFLRGLMEEIGPELRRIEPELRDLSDEMGTMMARLLALIDELDAYHPPERLPNGDIILRRKTPEEAPRPPSDPPDAGPIDI